MDVWNSRTERLYGSDAIKKLHQTGVAVIGIGGVGSYIAEGLARSGVGRLLLTDADTVDVSNINRQLPALQSTVGQRKTDVMRQRILDINPEIICDTADVYIDEHNARRFFEESILGKGIGYIADAIDSISGKIALIVLAKEYGIKVISSMGTGNRVDPAKLMLTDVFSTSGCPLARKVRKELRSQGVERLTTVFSSEEPHSETEAGAVPSSSIFVPASAGLMIASAIVNDIIGVKRKDGKEWIE